MQPYFFPYIGYFQLINAVDKFVIYDDVSYIKQGWINRNHILISQKKHLFTIPVEDQSSNSDINQTLLNSDRVNAWYKKFSKTLSYEYGTSTNYEVIFGMINTLLNQDYNTISDLNHNIIQTICNYLRISTEIVRSSSIYKNKDINGVARVLDICRRELATAYVNPIGGKDLYEKELFLCKGINLYFLNPKFEIYPQKSKEFIPGLSIIDILMNCSIEQITEMLGQYSLE